MAEDDDPTATPLIPLLFVYGIAPELGLIKSSWGWKSLKTEKEEAEDEGFGIASGDGRFRPPAPRRREEVEEKDVCLDWESGLLERKGEGEEGVEGVEGVLDEIPSSFLALRITEWTRASGPNAKRIISFSPWSWISKRPMILEAFSGSKFWILEKTILVAS